MTWSETLALLPVAASCFVMIIARSAATSRVFAVRYRERVDEDADILGLAAAKAAAAVSGTFVVNGSPTQTAMADRAGARSQVAQLVFAGLVLLVRTGPLQYLPRCVLAGIVFTIAIGMIDVAGLRDIRRESPGESILPSSPRRQLSRSASSKASCSRSLCRSSGTCAPPAHDDVPRRTRPGRWTPVPATPGKETEPGLVVYRSGADLFYANNNRFADEVRALVESAPTLVRWFIVDAGATTDMDYFAARSIRDLLDDLAQQRVGLVFARVSPYLRSDMDRHGITARSARRGSSRHFTKPSPWSAVARSRHTQSDERCRIQPGWGLRRHEAPRLRSPHQGLPRWCISIQGFETRLAFPPAAQHAERRYRDEPFSEAPLFGYHSVSPLHWAWNVSCALLITATIGRWSHQSFRSLSAGLQVTRASSTIAATAIATRDPAAAPAKNRPPSARHHGIFRAS